MIPYSSIDLGNLVSGDVVVVSIGNQANVRLLSRSNFELYKRGCDFQSYYAGWYKKTPVSMVVPHDDHWYVVVDLGGANAIVKCAASVIPGQ